MNYKDLYLDKAYNVCPRKWGGLYLDEDGSATVGLKYRGDVATKTDLPTTAEVGDMYNCLDTGVNYVWTGTSWDPMSADTDSALSTTSVNPVANAAITAAFENEAVGYSTTNGIEYTDYTGTKSYATIPDATTTTAGLESAADKAKVDTIGDVASLTTTAKTTLVSAVNELDSIVDQAFKGASTVAGNPAKIQFTTGSGGTVNLSMPNCTLYNPGYMQPANLSALNGSYSAVAYDTATDKLTLTKNDASTSTVTLPTATTTADGLMASGDKTNLNSAFNAATFDAGTHTFTFTNTDATTDTLDIGEDIVNDVSIGVNGTRLAVKSKKNGATTSSASNIPQATTTADGVMSKDDKVDLNSAFNTAALTGTGTTADPFTLTLTPVDGTATTMSWTGGNGITSVSGTTDEVTASTTSGAATIGLATKVKTDLNSAFNAASVTAAAAKDTITFTNVDSSTDAVDIPAATTTAAGVMTSTDKTNLNSAFKSASITAAAAKDTLTLTPVSGTASTVDIPAATTTAAGVMTKDDKTDLNASFSSATITGSGTTADPYKLNLTPNDGTATSLTLPSGGGGTITSVTGTTDEITATTSSGAVTVGLATAAKNDIAGSADASAFSCTANTLSITDNDGTGYSVSMPNATTTVDGSMAAADKVNLNSAFKGASVTAAAAKDTITFTNVDSSTDTVDIPAATTSAAGVMTSTDKTNLNAAYKDSAYASNKITFTLVDGTTDTVTLGNPYVSGTWTESSRTLALTHADGTCAAADKFVISAGAAGGGITSIANTDGALNPVVSGTAATINMTSTYKNYIDNSLATAVLSGSGTTADPYIITFTQNDGGTSTITLPSGSSGITTVTGTDGITASVSGTTATVKHSNSVTAGTNKFGAISYDAQGHITGTTAYSTDRGIDVTSNAIGHTNSVTADTTNTANPVALQYDEYGHVTGVTKLWTVTNAFTPVGSTDTFQLNLTAYESGNPTYYTKKMLFTNGLQLSRTDGGGSGTEADPYVQTTTIGHSNSITAGTNKFGAISYDAQGHITGTTAYSTDRGIDVTSNAIGHTNSVTASTTDALKFVKYDAQGHITSSTAKDYIYNPHVATDSSVKVWTSGDCDKIQYDKISSTGVTSTNNNTDITALVTQDTIGDATAVLDGNWPKKGAKRDADTISDAIGVAYKFIDFLAGVGHRGFCLGGGIVTTSSFTVSAGGVLDVDYTVAAPAVGSPNGLSSSLSSVSCTINWVRPDHAVLHFLPGFGGTTGGVTMQDDSTIRIQGRLYNPSSGAVTTTLSTNVVMWQRWSAVLDEAGWKE